ncbi:hypothetical protein XAPC_4208 [Xanthomonas citri pv. punicae str. LMG 859]|nr:hypothetical protein XAPC_4208 [Xanthomonas citri pv. punicae str. LMG 859]
MASIARFLIEEGGGAMRGTASYCMTAIGGIQRHSANIRLAQSSVYTRAACRTASPNAPAWRRRFGCLRSR